MATAAAPAATIAADFCRRSKPAFQFARKRFRFAARFRKALVYVSVVYADFDKKV